MHRFDTGTTGAAKTETFQKGTPSLGRTARSPASSKQFLQRLESLVRRLRSESGTDASQSILERCHRLVSASHTAGLTKEDRLDIVHTAVSESWSELTSPLVTPLKAATTLQRAIWKLKKRTQREAHRRLDLHYILEIGPGNFDAEERQHDFHERALCHAIVTVICEAMARALEQLGNRPHALIVREYRLEQYGIEPRCAVAPLKPQTRRKALQRARRSFAMALEAELDRNLEQGNGNRLVVEKAKELVKARPDHIRFDDVMDAVLQQQSQEQSHRKWVDRRDAAGG